MIVRPKLILLLFGFSFYFLPTYAENPKTDDFGKGKLLLQRAQSQSTSDSLEWVVKTCLKAAQIFEENDSLVFWFQAHLQITDHLSSQAKFPKAIMWGDSIIQHVFRKPDSRIEKIYYGWFHKIVGGYLISVGNFKQAEIYLLKAEKTMEAADYNFENGNYGLYGALGKVYNHFREPEKADYYFKRLIECAKNQEDWGDVIFGHDGLAVNYFNQGKYDEALLEYRKALLINEVTEDVHANLYMNIADAYRVNNNYPLALFMAQKAHDYYERVIPEKEGTDEFVDVKTNLIRSLNLLGNLYVETKAYRQAQDVFKEAIEVLESSREIVDSTEFTGVLISRANLKAEMKQWKSALDDIQQAIWYFFPEIDRTDILSHPSKKARSKDFLALDALMMKAEILNKRYSHTLDPTDLKLALETLLSLNQIMENTNKTYDFESAKMILASDNFRYQERAIQIALKLYRVTGNKTYAEQAYHFSEKTKSMILQESIKNITAWDLAEIPEDIRKEEERLRQELATYEASLTEYRDYADENLVMDWESRVFEAKKSYQALIKNIEKKFPRYYELKYKPYSPTLNEIGAYLGKEEAVLIEYFWGEEFLNIFALDGNEIYTHSIPLDSTDLEESLLKFIKYLRNPVNKLTGMDPANFSYFTSSSRTLCKQLLTPVLSKIEDKAQKKLIIIPGGILGYLPFEILLTNDSIPSDPDYSILPYLLKDYGIKYDYSANLLMNYARSTPTSEFKYGGFAPSYKSDFEVGSWKLGGLFYNQKEVNLASDIMEGESFLDTLATKTTFLDHLGQYDILHFAMHALMDDQQPERSGLAFFHADNSPKVFPDSLRSIEIDSLSGRSFLYVFEIYKLRIQADLVVLSACNTGIGQLAKGEGIMSLARAFAYAGCPGLVMSLWQVDDAQTQVLMESFFANLKAGMEKDEALRQAKLSFLNTEDANHPFFWASFVQTGNSGAFRNSFNWLLWGFGLGMFMLLVGAIWVWQKKSEPSSPEEGPNTPPKDISL